MRTHIVSGEFDYRCAFVKCVTDLGKPFFVLGEEDGSTWRRLCDPTHALFFGCLNISASLKKTYNGVGSYAIDDYTYEDDESPSSVDAFDIVEGASACREVTAPEHYSEHDSARYAELSEYPETSNYRAAFCPEFFDDHPKYKTPNQNAERDSFGVGLVCNFCGYTLVKPERLGGWADDFSSGDCIYGEDYGPRLPTVACVTDFESYSHPKPWFNGSVFYFDNVAYTTYREDAYAALPQNLGTLRPSDTNIDSEATGTQDCDDFNYVIFEGYTI